MKDQEFLLEDQEEKKEFDILPEKEDVEKLFQAELKQMMDVRIFLKFNFF